MASIILAYNKKTRDVVFVNQGCNSLPCKRPHIFNTTSEAEDHMEGCCCDTENWKHMVVDLQETEDD